MLKSRQKRKSPKRTLALPDLEQAKAAVLNTSHRRAANEPTISDHPIRRMVLLGTTIRVQPGCRSSLQLVPTNQELRP